MVCWIKPIFIVEQNQTVFPWIILHNVFAGLDTWSTPCCLSGVSELM